MRLRAVAIFSDHLAAVHFGRLYVRHLQGFTPHADALIQLNLSDVRFTRTLSGKYAWGLKSVMVVTWNRNTSRPRHSYKIYEYTSRSLPLDDWLENDGEILNQALDDCVHGLTGQMVEDIHFRDS